MGSLSISTLAFFLEDVFGNSESKKVRAALIKTFFDEGVIPEWSRDRLLAWSERGCEGSYD